MVFEFLFMLIFLNLVYDFDNFWYFLLELLIVVIIGGIIEFEIFDGCVYVIIILFIIEVKFIR